MAKHVFEFMMWAPLSSSLIEFDVVTSRETFDVVGIVLVGEVY